MQKETHKRNNKIQQYEYVSNALPRVEAAVEKRNPYPAQKQEDQHEREGERKPGAKVDDVTVWEVALKKENQKMSCQTNPFSLYLFFL